jgi:hypothetical protein
MSVCTYDNPDTLSRECWQDGRLISAYQLGLMMSKSWPPPPENLFFGANVGPWKSGQLLGDPTAMSANKVASKVRSRL